jgi:hypothetical protein
MTIGSKKEGRESNESLERVRRGERSAPRLEHVSDRELDATRESHRAIREAALDGDRSTEWPI